LAEGHLHSVPEHLRDNVIDTLSPDEDGDLQLAPEYGADRVQELADAVFDRYYQDMNQASTEHEQLRAIGRVVRTLHVIHPFNDGNGRLNVYVLLPRLLQVNGFRPVIAPSMAHLFSGGFSLDHIARALRWGQDRDLSIGLDDMGESAPWHQTGDGVGGSGNASAQASGSDVATSASSDDTARRH
jgi:hypothetical protein